MRVAAAVTVLGAAIAAAFALAGYQTAHSASNCRTGGGYGSPTVPCSWTTKPGWVVPAAIMVGFLGLALASLIARHKTA